MQPMVSDKEKEAVFGNQSNQFSVVGQLLMGSRWPTIKVIYGSGGQILIICM